MWRFWITFCLFAVTACAQRETPLPRQSIDTPAAFSTDNLPPPMQCASFAREVSGIPLHGDASTWWDQAANRFPRGITPKQDAILVLRATQQLPSGHVAVVRKVIGPREITVTHTNWGSDDQSRRLIHDSMAVIDVSANNDWSELRFWNASAQAFGHVYPAYGFILPQNANADLQAAW